MERPEEMQRAPGARAWLLAGLLAACTGPVLYRDPHVPLDLAQAGYPEATELLELEVDEGVFLRGVFVSAGPGAPVVLHLVGSGSSTAGFSREVCGRREVLHPDVTATLARCGIASVQLDYEGVGLSDGEPDPEHFERDVVLMWDAALARAGSPERVVVNAISIGTLPAALLLRVGRRPGGVVLIAPVRNETVGRRYVDRNFPRLIAPLVRLFVRAPLSLDTVEALTAPRVPLLVLSPQHDHFLPGEEQARFRAAVLAAGGTWIRRGADHSDLSLQASHALDEVVEFVQEVTRAVPAP